VKLCVVEGDHAAVGMLDKRDFARAEEALRDDNAAESVLAGSGFR